MKQTLKWLAVMCCIYASAQNTSVTYLPSTAVFGNPERGFWKYSATRGSEYQPLDLNTLTNYRVNNNITVIFRYYYLDTFINSYISDSYLTKMQADFDKIRNAGLKCVLRFAYTEDESVTPHDATLARILDHIAQLKPILLDNADVIATVQAGFIGTWGEWFYTSQHEFGGWGFNETNLTQANINFRRQVVEALLDALPATRMVMVRKPSIKEDLYSTSALLDNQGFNETSLARIGHHNDCFLATADDLGTYDNPTVEYPYLAQDTKFVPMGGETCRLNSPRTDCATATAEMNRFHWSFLNRDYYPSVIEGFQDQECFTEVEKKLGYRFILKSGTYPNNALSGGTMTIILKINNQGFAAPFNKRIAYIVLKNTLTGQVFKVALASDPRRWLGTSDINISEALPLPAGMPAGTYKMYLYLPDDSPSIAARPEYAIRMADESMWESATGYNSLNHTINIESQLGIADHEKLDMKVYPVPANNAVNIEMEGIGEFDITVYNHLGQVVKVPTLVGVSRITAETAGLTEGLYFFEFSRGTVTDTRKIIIRH